MHLDEQEPKVNPGRILLPLSRMREVLAALRRESSASEPDLAEIQKRLLQLNILLARAAGTGLGISPGGKVAV